MGRRRDRHFRMQQLAILSPLSTKTQQDVKGTGTPLLHHPSPLNASTYQFGSVTATTSPTLKQRRLSDPHTTKIRLQFLLTSG